MTIPSELLDLQPSMLRAIVHSELDARLYDWINLPQQQVPERLNVYRVSSRMTVLSALKKTFKAMLKYVGEMEFNHVARAFLQQQCCMSADIGQVGEGFSAYLKEKGRGTFISNLAAFEWSWRQVFHGPSHALPDTQQLQQHIVHHQENLPLQRTPGLVLLSSIYPLPELWQAVIAEQNIDALLMAGEHYFALHQQAGKVQVQEIAQPLYQALQCLQLPQSLVQWIEHYQQQTQQSFAPEWVSTLFESGLIQLGT